MTYAAQLKKMREAKKLLTKAEKLLVKCNSTAQFYEVFHAVDALEEDIANFVENQKEKLRKK